MLGDISKAREMDGGLAMASCEAEGEDSDQNESWCIRGCQLFLL